MSLLNDALRAAEQRQQKPEAPAAYTGQAYAVPVRKNRLVQVLGVMVVVLAAVAGYAVFAGKPSAPETAEAATPESLPPVVEQVSEESQATEPRNAPEPAPEPRSEPAPVPEQPVARETRPEPEKPEVSQAQPVQPESEAASVKEIRETPESIDRRVSRELVSLLREGRSREAAEKLKALLTEQQAPVSRATLARALLVEGQPEIALAWLPASEVMAVPDLRLLRARALLATGDLNGAVAVLRSQVPPLTGHIEYRVTLATLLQQAGESGAAAEQWTALLTTDDSRAAWWVGLGVALESQGKATSAARAYSQAAALPGLSSSLADYVRERLKQLQAG
ncbi:MAG: hypothetical protein HUJ18_02790 [Marinobacter sp.]|nr:hypothetical protein [Marinobacter sp.]